MALPTLPLATMLVAALLGIERLTLRKSAGVLMAISGVAAASWWTGGFDVVGGFGPGEWVAVAYRAGFGGAAAFVLWVFALARTTPTRVAGTMTLNPVAGRCWRRCCWTSRSAPRSCWGSPPSPPASGSRRPSRAESPPGKKKRAGAVKPPGPSKVLGGSPRSTGRTRSYHHWSAPLPHRRVIVPASRASPGEKGGIPPSGPIRAQAQRRRARRPGFRLDWPPEGRSACAAISASAWKASASR